MAALTKNFICKKNSKLALTKNAIWITVRNKNKNILKNSKFYKKNSKWPT